MEESDEDESILSGFKKVQDKSSVDGFAEGLSDGRDAVFQQGFDAGFEDAFKFAFILGQYKALKGPISLENTSRGECLTCLDANLVKLDLKILREKQISKNTERISQLKTDFGEISYENETKN
ncbi:uncharacterized protein LOC134833104 [Culicoides brevitarsis]|uniref:uncharacterized protein LOC134833104 n=1 Tax=Culicoides brevitarsis TaxID=469753 RepID=UPI00307C144E